MNEFIGEITLDLDCRKTMPKISAGQFDKGRKYLIHITANGSAFPASGSTVIIQGIHQDKSLFSAACSLDSEGNVILVLTQDILSVKGFAYAKLVLSDSNKNYSTQVFIIDVDGSYEGDITADENYSIVNDFMNKLMTLFDLESPSDMLNTYPCIKEITEADLDIAVDRNTIYDVYSEIGSNRFYQYRIMCISDRDTRIQYRFSASAITAQRIIDTRVQARNVVNDTWLAWSNWTSIAADKVDKSRKIAGINLQADIAAANLKAALAVPTKTSDLTNDRGFLAEHQDISGKVDKSRKIAGIDLQDDIGSDELADALWNDFGGDGFALLQQVSVPNLTDLKQVPKGQYYYSSERGTLGVKLSEATSSSDPSAAQYIETYDTEQVDGKLANKENGSNKSNDFSFELTPTKAEANQYPTVARMKELLSGTYYDIAEIDSMIGNVESLLASV